MPVGAKVESPRQAVAAVVLIVLLVAAAVILFQTDGSEIQSLEERYGDVDDYRGQMIVNTTIVGERENSTVYVENATGDFVENRSLLPQKGFSFTGPPRVVTENASVTVREFDGVVDRRTNRTIDRRVRIVTERFRGTIDRRSTVADVVYRRPDTYRYDYESAPDPSLVTVVIEGDDATRYLRGGRVDELPTRNLGIEAVGVRFADFLVNLTDRYTVARNGTATVGGSRTEVLNLTPRTEVDRPLDRVWIDRETELPIRVRMRRSIGGRTVTTVVTYRDMSYDQGVSDGTFEVDVDALPSRRPGAETRRGGRNRTATGGADSNVSYTEYGTLAAAQDAVDFDVVAPSETASLAFDGARVKTLEGNRSVRLRYRNGTDRMVLLVTRSLTPRGGPLGPRARNVTVGPSEGRAVELGDGVPILRWACGGYRFELSGTLPLSTLRRVGASVACE